MTCYHPLKAYRGEKDGKPGIVFVPKASYIDLPSDRRLVTLPCGQCVGCRLERSRQWAMRCAFESQTHEENSFITLTYDNEHLPKDYSLNKKHWQDFMKRLRWHFSDRTIRYFHAGEYGEQLGRPHYHALIFGLDFSDKILWMVRNGHRLYRSPTLENIWPFGYSSVGAATFESAAYVARYCLKKVTGDGAKDHYNLVDSNTGELFTRLPEYATMSRRPGIGKRWFDRYKDDVYPLDKVVLRGGVLMKPPRYFDNLYQLEFPEQFSVIKEKRQASFKEVSEDFSSERLADREYIQLRKLQRLPRSLI